MLDRFAIGTANFSLPYGAFSSGAALSMEEIDKILVVAKASDIVTFDTAPGYGGIPLSFKKLKNSQIITKFSISSDQQTVIDQIKALKDRTGVESIYGLLIHDPQNIEQLNKSQFCRFAEQIQSELNVKHIGISVYTPEDLFKFSEIYMPSLIQIPLNPLNQSFLKGDVQDFLVGNDIEVHARSLFLQGVLLNERLPSHLLGLADIMSQFRSQISGSKSDLAAILKWALAQSFISKWVIGVMSADHLHQIIQTVNDIGDMESPDFSIFRNLQHPLIDPRNWSTS